jgi:purine nucleosidase
MNAMQKTTVIIDQDGGQDDFLSTALLLTMPNVRTLGVVVTPGDCFIDPAVRVTRRLLDLIDISGVPVAESTVRGLNPFPREWRKTAFAVENFPVLAGAGEIRTPLEPEPGQRFIARALAESREPVTLLVTGPLTTVAEALKIDPGIEPQIEQIVWMGGALNVPGNVNPAMEPGHDGTAEWNVYWDPPAAHAIWQTEIPIVLCPLDITNHVPVTAELVRKLGGQRQFPLSDLAAHCYALVLYGEYYFWDVLTTAYLGRPDLFTLRDWETEVVPDGPSAGRTKVVPGGRRIRALDTVDVEGFYDYILAAWQR